MHAYRSVGPMQQSTYSQQSQHQSQQQVQQQQALYQQQVMYQQQHVQPQHYQQHHHSQPHHQPPVQHQIVNGGNQLLNQYERMQTAGYSAQVNQVIGQNKLLINPMLIGNRDSLLTKMRLEKEEEALRRVHQRVQNNEMTQTDLMRQLVIRPIELPKRGTASTENDIQTMNKDVHIQYDFVNSSWNEQRGIWQKNRTNTPYKTIINSDANRDDSARMLEKEKRWLENGGRTDDDARPTNRDLIVHVVSDADKCGIAEKYTTEDEARQQLDSQHRLIYSKENKTKHIKQFEYKHVYMYRVKIDSKNHIELRDDRVAYYEEQQKKLESTKAQSDALLRMMQESDMIDKELLDTGLENPEYTTTVDIEVDNLMSELGITASRDTQPVSRPIAHTAASTTSTIHGNIEKINFVAPPRQRR